MVAVPQVDILASKHVPFDDSIPEMWVNYTGAAVAMHVRNEPGDQGDPIITLGASVAEAEGIEITYDPDYADPDGGDPGASIVRIIIDEATLESEDVPYGADPADPVTLYYDIHITPVGGAKFVYCAGKFIVDPGVTL